MFLSHPPHAEPSRSPRPSDAATAAQQAVAGLLVALPLAVSVALRSPTASNSTQNLVTVTPDLASALAAGRALWQQQASRTDKLQCTPFNGPAQLLKDATAAAAAAVPTPEELFPPNLPQLAAARAAFAATARAVAVEGSQHSSSRLDPFRRALKTAGYQQEGLPSRGDVLPDPVADASADVMWDGGDSSTAAIAPGPGMSAAAVSTAKLALHDDLANVVPWLAVKVSAAV